MSIQDQNFGIEIEMTGLTRSKAAKVIGEYFNKDPVHEGRAYDKYTVKDFANRNWTLMSDGSIDAEYSSGRSTSSNAFKVELVSPICQYQDINDIQKMVRKLRSNGARVNTSCGIHIHIDASRFNSDTLRNLTNIMYSKEDIIYKALKVEGDRERDYCKKVDNSFIEKLNKHKPKNMDDLSQLWYNGPSRGHTHYHFSRYHGLNIHSVFQKGTVEFRLFNGSLHAGEIKAYIQFCLAITNQALSQKSASKRKTITTNEKYTFRTWLLRLGMIGDEFKTARLHLLKNLDGCIAWKDAEQSIQQRERLREQRAHEAENEIVENSVELTM